MTSELAEVLAETEAAEAELDTLRAELDLPALRRRIAEAEATHAATQAEVAELLHDKRMAIAAAVFAAALLAAGLVLVLAIVVTRGRA